MTKQRWLTVVCYIFQHFIHESVEPLLFSCFYFDPILAFEFIVTFKSE